MTLDDIATISGKGGLFKVFKPAKSGVILESLDEAKTKIVATANNRLSILSEISIYTTTKEGTVPLADVLKKINSEYGDDLGLDSEADAAELKSFLKSVLPEYDETRVYVSDIKKLVKWYSVLLKYAPEILQDKTTEEEEEEEEQKVNKWIFLTILFATLHGALAAQQNFHLYKQRDFSSLDTTNIDIKELQAKLRKERAMHDSLYVARIDSLAQLVHYLSEDHTGYSGISYSLLYVPQDYKKLLDDLEANGFNTGPGNAFGFAASGIWKRKRFIHEWGASFFLGSKMKSETNEWVRVSGGNFFSYNFGFELLGLKRVNLYPFIGLNHQLTSIRYKRNSTGSQDYGSLLEIPIDVNDVRIKKHDLRFAFGGELDVYVMKQSYMGIILGLRYGINKTLLEGNYKAEHRTINYNPDVDLKSSYVEVVLKFFGPGYKELR